MSLVHLASLMYGASRSGILAYLHLTEIVTGMVSRLEEMVEHGVDQMVFPRRMRDARRRHGHRQSPTRPESTR